MFLLGDSTKNMNQGRVRLQESRNKLGQLLKQDFKKAYRTLAIVNIDSAVKSLEQTLATLKAASKIKDPLTHQSFKPD